MPKIEEQFKDFILEKDHPCLMAQTAMLDNQYSIKDYGDISDKHNIESLYEDLGQYIKTAQDPSNKFFSYVAIFSKDQTANEIDFENKLWDLLSALSHQDNHSWDERVSSDVSHPNFSYSLFGEAFYVVGMHPNSSRASRSAPQTTIVFNLHSQFERLREMGVYENVRDRIRQRDEELQGSTNPMLDDFGDHSEACQYSGRKVPESWKCPFHSEPQ